MIPSMGLLNTMAVLQARLSENELRNLPDSTIGWILSSYAFFLYFCGAQVGKEMLSFLSQMMGEVKRGRWRNVDEMKLLLTNLVKLGPIFDAYDVRVLIIPGNIGIVISMMLIGLCKGWYSLTLTCLCISVKYISR